MGKIIKIEQILKCPQSFSLISLEITTEKIHLLKTEEWRVIWAKKEREKIPIYNNGQSRAAENRITAVTTRNREKNTRNNQATKCTLSIAKDI